LSIIADAKTTFLTIVRTFVLSQTRDLTIVRIIVLSLTSDLTIMRMFVLSQACDLTIVYMFVLSGTSDLTIVRMFVKKPAMETGAAGVVVPSFMPRSDGAPHNCQLFIVNREAVKESIQKKLVR
jgi:hypothetical protein